RRSLSKRHSASFCSSSSSRVIAFSSGFDRVFRAVEGKRGRLAVDERLQVNRPAPNELEVRQRVRGVIEPQLHAIVLVAKQQFAAVAVIAVHYKNPRFTKVRQAKQQSLLHFLEFARLDEVTPGLLLPGKAEQVVPDAELGREERVDKG